MRGEGLAALQVHKQALRILVTRALPLCTVRRFPYLSVFHMGRGAFWGMGYQDSSFS